MDIRCRNKRWITCLYAIPLACGLGAFAPEVHSQNATSQRATQSTSPGAAAVMNHELSGRVRAALHADPYFYDRHVDVTVEGDAVVLRGIVFDDWDLRGALRIARKAAGNRPVVDNLSIEQGGR
jgi:osmotically-inducible protein OsmY